MSDLLRRLLVPWGILLGVVLLVGLGLSVENLDPPTPFAIPHAYRLLVGSELFFLLVVVPLLVSGREAARRRGESRIRPSLGEHKVRPYLALSLLLATAAPVVVVASWVSDCDWAPVAASQGYLLVAAALAAGYVRADPAGLSLGWYWLAAGALGGGAPLIAFVAGDFLRAQVGWLYSLSPFWVADRLSRAWEFGWDWAVPFACLLLAAIGLFAWSLRRR